MQKELVAEHVKTLSPVGELVTMLRHLPQE